MTMLKQSKLVSALLLLAISLCQLPYVAGQQPSTKPTDQDEVIRVKTDLIQVRAVVTDKKGEPVDNLKEEDFEVLENGRPQPLSFFTIGRIENTAVAANPAGPKPAAAGDRPTQPTALSKPVRSMVLFVDTLHLSPLSLVQAKKHLKQFVDEKMTDQDLAAVVTTSSSLGVLQQFMRDRKMLKYAIDKITGFTRLRTFFTPFLAARVLSEDAEALSVATAIMAKEEYGGSMSPPPGVVRGRARMILEEESVLRRSTLQTIKGVSDRMTDLPGQRMIAFVSEGFTLLDQNGAEHDDFNAATGRAVRSGVIIYSFNPLGLTTPVEFTAAAPLGGFAFGNYMHDSELDQQDTLRDIAHVTGGDAYLNSNDIVGQFKKMLDANRIYYALAYYPQVAADKKFRSLKVRIKNHPEYHVRAQSGYQPTLEKQAEVAATPQEKLFQAMLAPLPLTTIGVTVAADYLERRGDDAQVTVQIHFAGDSLEYPMQEQKRALSCEVVLVVFDHEGKMTSNSSETISAAFTAEQLEKARHNGYRYNKRLKLAPGLYQLRVGIRDVNGSLMGTSLSWVEVPDLNKKKLTLSSIFLGKDKSEEQLPVLAAANKTARPSLIGGPASFKHGEPIFYRFVLYNSTTGQANEDLQLKVEVLESGTNAYDGSWQPVTPRIVRSDGMGLEIGGLLRMEVAPGVYTLRVTVRDMKSKKETQQTIAFEIAA